MLTKDETKLEESITSTLDEYLESDDKKAEMRASVSGLKTLIDNEPETSAIVLQEFENRI